MKTFYMKRNADESGVSGVGIVLSGVVFDSGKTVVQWDVLDKPNSIGVYESFEDFKFLHIDSHPTNGTEIVWITSVVIVPKD